MPVSNCPFSILEGYFYAFNLSINELDTLWNTRETFYIPPNTSHIGLETSFSYPETLFNGRERMLTPRDTFLISLDRSFTYPGLSFTCRDRLCNLSGCIENRIGGVDNLDGTSDKRIWRGCATCRNLYKTCRLGFATWNLD